MVDLFRPQNLKQEDPMESDALIISKKKDNYFLFILLVLRISNEKINYY